MKASRLFAVRNITFGFDFEHVTLFYYLKVLRVKLLMFWWCFCSHAEV